MENNLNFKGIEGSVAREIKFVKKMSEKDMVEKFN